MPHEDEPRSNHISTADLELATDYIDSMIEKVRQVHAYGISLDVEELTLVMLAGIAASGSPELAIIAQQSLMLAVCVQRLAR